MPCGQLLVDGYWLMVVGYWLTVDGSEFGEKDCQDGEPRKTRTTRKRLPACFTAKTQRMRGLLRPRQINRASYTAGKALPGWFNAIGDEPAESRSVATVKDASSGPVAQLGAILFKPEDAYPCF